VALNSVISAEVSNMCVSKMHIRQTRRLQLKLCANRPQVRQSTVEFPAATHHWSYYSLEHARRRRREQNRIYLYTTVNLKRNF